MEPNPHALKETVLKPVSQNSAFVVCRGDRIVNIYDLANCFEHLNLDQFHAHVGKGYNHVATWVEEVLHDPFLAKDLNLEKNLEDQRHFVKTIRDHVAWLEAA